MAEARREKPAAAGFSAWFEKAITLGETEKEGEGESKFRPLFAPQPAAGEESRLLYRHVAREAGRNRGGERPLRKQLDYGGKWSWLSRSS